MEFYSTSMVKLDGEGKKLKKKKEQEKETSKVPPRLELGLLDSKSKVITITPRDQTHAAMDFV